MKKSLLPLLALLLGGAIMLSLLTGRYPISPGDVARILTGRCDNGMMVSVFTTIRLPRALLAALAGMTLSLAGWVYQNVFMNALVSPDVLGVSSGCSIGAICAILLNCRIAAIQLGSFFSGLTAVAVTLLLARCIGGHRNLALLLSGIVVGAAANSIIMLFKYTADPNGELAAIEYWLMGSFHTAKWADVGAALPAALAGCTVILLLRRSIRLLALGDEEAQALGVPVGPVKYAALLAATALVAGVVSVAGIVSWLGLIVPHMCRLFTGERSDTPLAVMLCGGALLTLADWLARCLSASEIPISILTSFMGAVFLLGLLIFRRVRPKENRL